MRVSINEQEYDLKPFIGLFILHKYKPNKNSSRVMLVSSTYSQTDGADDIARLCSSRVRG